MKIEPKFEPGDEVYVIESGSDCVIIRKRKIDYIAVEKNFDGNAVIEYAFSEEHYVESQIFAKLEDTIGGLYGLFDVQNKGKG